MTDRPPTFNIPRASIDRIERASPLTTKTQHAFKARYFGRKWQEATRAAGLESITLPDWDQAAGLHSSQVGRLLSWAEGEEMKAALTAGELERLVVSRLGEAAAGCTISVHADPATGWQAVAYCRTFDALSVQIKVERITQELRALYVLAE